MISILLPLSENSDYTRATVISIETALGGNPYEILYIERENSIFDDEFIKTGNYKLISCQENDFGLQLNEATKAINPQSSLLLFTAPGNIFFSIPYNELINDAQKNPFDVTAFRVGRMKNPNTNKIQTFPSWFGLATSVFAFNQIKGFSPYLPIVGGDLLYSLEVIKRGGSLRRLNNSCRELVNFEVSDPEIIAVHKKLLVKRLPMIMSGKGLRGDIMEGWPGVVICK